MKTESEIRGAGEAARPAACQQVYCNRSLNLRSIRAIGFDMDYTLVHYNVEAWERRAFEHLRERLAVLGWPVSDLEFDPEAVTRGLLIDRAQGNLVKANRFGYVKRAAHGTRLLSQSEKKQRYGRTVVDGDAPRFASLNTLFSLSEATMFAMLVDRLDEGQLPVEGGFGYRELYETVRGALDEAHMEGRLKAEIMADPTRFVESEPAVATTLLDQRDAGLKLAVITNSEWSYTRFMLGHAIDPHLPGDMTWRELFDLVVVSSRKPDFFESERLPAFAVDREEGEGLLRASHAGIDQPGVWLGGNASMVERLFGVDGSEVLYVGDHMYGDVRPSKGLRRWRTALILRELEDEITALEGFAPKQDELAALMARKEQLERLLSRERLAVQRSNAQRSAGVEGDPAVGAHDATVGGCAKGSDAADEIDGGVLDGGRGDTNRAEPDEHDGRDLEGRDASARRMAALRADLRALDARIAPLATAANALGNPRWGPILRTGKDKSALARHVEQHADLYTSRVSNFGRATPFAYFRAPYGSLPHDAGPATTQEQDTSA